MSLQIDKNRLFKAMDRTWAPAEMTKLGPWTLRKGLSGGQRVSAATSEGPVGNIDIDQAENAMDQLGQEPLFMVRSGDEDLDLLLERRGYKSHDPVLVYASLAKNLTLHSTDLHDAIPCDEPLALMREIWQMDGIGTARLQVMQRSVDPKAFLFSRRGQRPGGVGFIAVDNDIAMLHALVVLPETRRLGIGRRMIGRAAFWAIENGAKYMGVAVTSENLPAAKLYSGLGMQIIDKYHYRKKKDA